MTTTISTTPPDIPLPAGAVFGDAWEGDDPQRVIMGPLRGITDTYARVENGGMRSSEVAAQAGSQNFVSEDVVAYCDTALITK